MQHPAVSNDPASMDHFTPLDVLHGIVQRRRLHMHTSAPLMSGLWRAFCRSNRIPFIVSKTCCYAWFSAYACGEMLTWRQVIAVACT